MRLALLNTKDTARARYILDAFRIGAAVHGDECVWVRGEADLPRLAAADLGVQVCLANRHHNGEGQGEFRLQAQAALRAAGKRVLVIDTGFVRNQMDYELAHSRTFDVLKPTTYPPADKAVYYEVSYDGIKGYGDHCNAGAPGDRWMALRRPIKPWQAPKLGRYVLMLAQPLHGQSSQDVNIYEWVGTAVRSIRAVSKRPIVIRRHPRFLKVATPERLRKDTAKFVAKLPARTDVSWTTGKTLEADLRYAWAAVVYSSNAGVTAVLEGIPLFVGSPACMAATVAGVDLTRIEQPPTPDRTAWANAMAYAQWTVAELRSGACWARYRPHATAPPYKGPLL